MTKSVKLTAFAVAAIALAGCAADSGRPSTSTTATRAPSSVESTCVAAVASEVRNNAVSLIRSEVSEGTGQTVVYVNVPGAQAPWACYATPAGAVLRVEYTGSEGAM